MGATAQGNWKFNVIQVIFSSIFYFSLQKILDTLEYRVLLVFKDLTIKISEILDTPDYRKSLVFALNINKLIFTWNYQIVVAKAERGQDIC